MGNYSVQPADINDHVRHLVCVPRVRGLTTAVALLSFSHQAMTTIHAAAGALYAAVRGVTVPATTSLLHKFFAA